MGRANAVLGFLGLALLTLPVHMEAQVEAQASKVILRETVQSVLPHVEARNLGRPGEGRTYVWEGAITGGVLGAAVGSIVAGIRYQYRSESSPSGNSFSRTAVEILIPTVMGVFLGALIGDSTSKGTP